MTTEQYSIGYEAGYQDGFDAALAEPVKQEPVVWYCPDCGTLSETQVKCCPDWIRSREVTKNFALTCKETFDRQNYAAPVSAKREWVDLTCQEITALIMEGAAGGGWQGFAERVLAAFKEKNK